MEDVNVKKYWVPCICGNKKIGKTTKDSNGGGSVDCKKCKREVPLIYREGLQEVNQC